MSTRLQIKFYNNHKKKNKMKKRQSSGQRKEGNV
ncbi:hypothetical protein Tsp_02407 [Trichinella spiralis]|nr:hypothetical protein Tsp_02407 [Trichinella spiralis]